MDIGHFYFLKDSYFKDFPDKFLMPIKVHRDGKLHGRPCFYSFLDSKTNLYWFIPISSQIGKYYSIYNKKKSKYGVCDTIHFAEVLGYKKAFLIQNMCPVSMKYIDKEYIDNRNGYSVRVRFHDEKDIAKKAKKVLTLVRKGKKLVFPDVLTIERELLK